MFVILDTIFLSLSLLTHNVSIRAYFNVGHIIDSRWISVELKARKRQSLSTLKAWLMTECKKCNIPKKAAWVHERNWPQWEVPNGQEKPDHGENQDTGQQEEVQTEMRFSGVAYQRSQESRGRGYDPLLLDDKRMPISLVLLRNESQGWVSWEKKNVRVWKNVITWML